MFSAATLASKESKRRKVQEVMDSCDIKMQGDGLTADEILTIAAVLGEANIKSSHQYLAELKLMQLEIGISWPDVLDRQLTMVKRALKRDVGPEVRAKEANPEDISVEAWETKLQIKGMPVRSAWAYAWAVLWMLRCVELVNLKASDVQLNFTKKTVSVNIRKSKMDQKGLGVKRTLQCCRGERCRRMCPWNLVRTLAEHTVKCDKAPCPFSQI